MTGEESYPIMGGCCSRKFASACFERFKGLQRHWHCLEKAQIVREVLGGGALVLGSLLVWSADLNSSYGYYWNPPMEFHAWVQYKKRIYDLALPGVIERGLNTSDHIGPVLTGRSPVILAGKPLPWTQYEAKEAL